MRSIINKCIVLVIALFITNTIHANEQIPDSLTQGAVAVVLNYSTRFVQENVSSGTYDVTKEIIILNKKGESYGHFVYWGDKFRELKDFSGTIKDSSGKIIRRIKRGDLTQSSLSDVSTIASDSYSIYVECNASSYPYTVEFKYQEKLKGGLISYPAFMPAPSFDISVLNANYTLELPEDIELRFKENFKSNISNEKAGGKNTYTVSVNNMKAVVDEPFSPSYREILPRILFAPIDFCYDSQCGNMSTWADYGKWVSGLLSGRDILKPAVVDQLIELTKNAKDDREKVRILYEYMQANSRYVSIQLGIGGLQPIEAEKVANSNFGDCKGLSNWMKAMLKAVGIKSSYCEISTREDTLYPDFANVSQTNHAILMVPLHNDTVWLECTSQTLPFGFLYDGIVGHDALVINEDLGKGIICRLPTYDNEENNGGIKLQVKLNEDGSANGNITFVEKLNGYANSYLTFRSNDRKRHVNYINSLFKVPNVTYNTITTTEDVSDKPWCRLDVDFTSSEFGSKTGSRFFIPLCPLNKGSMSMFSANKREHDIDVKSGYMEVDTIEYILPESFSIESMPKDITLNSLIGNYVAKAELLDNKILFTQSLEIKSGRYSKDNYNDIKEFLAEVATALRRKIVLKKM